MTRIRPFRPNYGDGSDGTWASAGTGQTYYLDDLPGGAKRAYNFTTFWLKATDTLYLRKRVDDGTRYIPVTIRAQVLAQIDGTINGDGLGHKGAPRNDYSTTLSEYGRTGDGPGGGVGGFMSYVEGGGGGGHATKGVDAPKSEITQYPWNRGGWAYDAIGDILRGIISDACAGSGGGSGAHGDPGERVGGKGGDGGAGLIVAAFRIVLGAACQILLRGTNGENGTGDAYAGGGGGGSGGFLALMGHIIETAVSGVLSALTGGVAGSGGGNPSGGKGGDGADGRAYMLPLQTITADAASRCNPAATVIDLKRLPILLG